MKKSLARSFLMVAPSGEPECFSLKEIGRIEVALRIRAESCHDNDENVEAVSWYRIHKKIVRLLNDGRKRKVRL